MGSKNSSLAVDEAKTQGRHKIIEVDFEPKLTVIVNKRLINNSANQLLQQTDTVKIRGKITISF